MPLKSLRIKNDYHRSLKEDVLNEFYIPCLKNASKYDRVTGFFSPTSLSAAAEGMASFIKNGGKYRLIFSKYIFSEQDYDAIKQGHLDSFIKECNITLERLEQLLKDKPRRILGWMIANNYLDIKIAFKIPDDAIEHSKWGNFEDSKGDRVHYGGSLNETSAGWTKKPEHTDVYCDWKNDSEKQRVDEYSEYFELLWNNELDDIEVINFPDVPKERFQINNNIQTKEEAIEESLELDQEIQNEKINTTKKDELSPALSDDTIEPYDYQQEAIDNWIKNGYKGIFALATGLGKTFTAIFSLIEFAKKVDNKYLAVVVVPSKELINQWKKEFKKFNLEAQIVNEPRHWKEEFHTTVHYLNMGIIKNKIILVTYNSYSNKSFIEAVEKCSIKKVIICDEAHNAGAKKAKKGLLESYDGRLALTATPKRHFDEDGTNLIQKYFSGVVISRNLKWGIENKWLCPYRYYVTEIKLTNQELEEYNKMTVQMMKHFRKDEPKQSDAFYAKAGLRADIIKAAENKVVAFEKALETLDLDGVFVFCAKQTQLRRNYHSQINSIQRILTKNTIKYKIITSKKEIQSMDMRNEAMKRFKNGDISVLVSIDCLDEGIDVPDAKIAIILSSTTNQKQYIQRRGRVLRMPTDNPEKIAVIHDYVCFPGSRKLNTKTMEQSLVRNQLKRLKEFSDISLNSKDNQDFIARITKEWELDIDE